MIELKFEYQFTFNEYFFKTKLIAVLLNHNHGIYFGILSQSQSRILEKFSVWTNLIEIIVCLKIFMQNIWMIFNKKKHINATEINERENI